MLITILLKFNLLKIFTFSIADSTRASAFINDPTLTPCTKVPLIPVTFDMPDGSQWTPRNSGNVQEGTMIELSKALALSINWISAFLIKEKTTPEAVVELAKSMGITAVSYTHLYIRRYIIADII